MKKFLLTFGVLAASLYASVAEATITTNWNFTNVGMAVNNVGSATFSGVSTNVFANGMGITARGGAYYYVDDPNANTFSTLGTISNLAGGLGVTTDATIDNLPFDNDLPLDTNFTATNTSIREVNQFSLIGNGNANYVTVGDAFELSFVDPSAMYNMGYQEYIILDMTNVLSLIGTASNVDLTLIVGELGSGHANIFGSVVAASNSLIPSDLGDLAIQPLLSDEIHINLNTIGLNAANPYLILTKVAFDSVPSGPSPEMYLKYLSVSFDNCVLEDNCSGGGDDDVPEPGLIGLFGFSLAGLAALRWRR